MGMDNTRKFEINYLLKRKKVIVRDIFLRKKNVVPPIDVQSSDQIHTQDNEKLHKPNLTSIFLIQLSCFHSTEKTLGLE